MQTQSLDVYDPQTVAAGGRVDRRGAAQAIQRREEAGDLTDLGEREVSSKQCRTAVARYQGMRGDSAARRGSKRRICSVTATPAAI